MNRRWWRPPLPLNPGEALRLLPDLFTGTRGLDPPSQQRVRAAHDPPRHSRARRTRAKAASRSGSAPVFHQGLCRSRSGTNLYPGTYTVWTDRGTPPTLLGTVRAAEVLLYAGGV